MTRLMGATLVLLCFAPAVEATLYRPKSIDRSDDTRRLVTRGLRPITTAVPPPAETALTADTEVVLDGRRCEYKDVPANASVVRMVLAADGKTITRVEFRTRK
jgi:hypothetical protein